MEKKILTQFNNSLVDIENFILNAGKNINPNTSDNNIYLLKELLKWGDNVSKTINEAHHQLNIKEKNYTGLSSNLIKNLNIENNKLHESLDQITPETINNSLLKRLDEKELKSEGLTKKIDKASNDLKNIKVFLINQKNQEHFQDNFFEDTFAINKSLGLDDKTIKELRDVSLSLEEKKFIIEKSNEELKNIKNCLELSNDNVKLLENENKILKDQIIELKLFNNHYKEEYITIKYNNDKNEIVATEYKNILKKFKLLQGYQNKKVQGEIQNLTDKIKSYQEEILSLASELYFYKKSYFDHNKFK